MILSDNEIKKAIIDGRLMIDPVPDNKAYDTMSVDLLLDKEIAIPGQAPQPINLKYSTFSSLYSTYAKHDLTHDGPYHLPPNEFILGNTFERVDFPQVVRPGTILLAGRVEGKSKYSRCGLMIHFTAPTIHNKWGGHIALEIINLGKTAIVLEHRMPICQLLVEEVLGTPSFVPPGSFQNQKTAGG